MREWRDALVNARQRQRLEALRAWRAPTAEPISALSAERVLYASASSAYSGAEASLCALIKAVDRNRIEPHALVSLSGEFRRGLEAVQVSIHCPERDIATNSTENLYLCLELLRRLRPSLVHANALVGWPLIYAATVMDSPLVQHVRVPYLDHLRSHVDAADRVIAVSDYVKAQLIRFGVPEDKIGRVHNGVDLDHFDRHALRQSEVSTQSNVRNADDPTCVVTMIARGARNKRHDLFVRALSRARRDTPVPLREIAVDD